MKSYLINIKVNDITTQNIKWRYICGGQVFYDGFILQDTFANIDDLDGTYSLLYLEKNNLNAYTDFWGTKPLFYCIEPDNITITSDPFKFKIENYKLIPRNTKVVISLRDLNISFHKKTSLRIRTDATKNTFTKSVCKIIDKIKSRRLGICLSEGYDSGVITSILLSNNKPFYAATIDIGTNTQILYERHKRIKTGCIIKPKLIDDLKTYKKYYSKIDNLILNESYEPDHTQAWGFKGSCMLLEALKENKINTSLHCSGADALFLPNIEKYIEYTSIKDLPYPYNEALDIQHSCIKGEFIAKMFNIKIIYIFLIREVWEISLGIIRRDNLNYKQFFAEIMSENLFPFIQQTSITTKVGLERCRLNSFL